MRQHNAWAGASAHVRSDVRPAQSLRTTQSWQQSSMLNMTNAQRSQDMASTQCVLSAAAHDDTVTMVHDMYSELNAHLAEKVDTSRGLLELLWQRAASMEKSVVATHKSMNQLKESLSSKDAPVRLCEWRIEQLQMRPQREKVRGDVEDALEDEGTKLASSRQQLSAAIAKTQGMLIKLNAKLSEVTRNIDQKTQSLMVDERCMYTAQSSYQVVSKRTPLRETSHLSGTLLRNAADKEALGTTQENELLRQQKVRHLDQSGLDREQEAGQMCEENQQLIIDCKQVAERAKATSDRCFRERLDAHRQIRTRLEGEITATDAHLTQTTSVISKTGFHIQALEEPMRVTASCTAWRKGRVPLEHILDPVASKLDEHALVSRTAQETLHTHREAAHATRQQLCAQRQQLLHDLKDKAVAHDIDQECLMKSVLPVPTATPRGQNVGWQSRPLVLPTLSRRM